MKTKNKNKTETGNFRNRKLIMPNTLDCVCVWERVRERTMKKKKHQWQPHTSEQKTNQNKWIECVYLEWIEIGIGLVS